jgi:hypothetical protein
MMKLYRYTFGEWVNYGPAVSDLDAFERRIGIDPQFHYVPVTIEEVKLEGYEITVSPINDVPTEREALKAWLNERNIEFTPQLGDAKLRELALSHGQT